MVYEKIIKDGIEYFLVPTPKAKKIEDKYKIRYKREYIEKHFDVELFGYSIRFLNGSSKASNVWVTFRRTEQENGDFNWVDWSTGGVNAKKDDALLLEKWYQDYVTPF